MKATNRIVFATAAGALMSAFSAGAATVSDCGPNVCYEWDDAQAAISLTGDPTRIGDAMTFLPEDFRAESLDGAGWITTTANFTFSRVYTVNAANEITYFTVWEEFDYQIINGGDVEATLFTDAQSIPNLPDYTSTTSNFSDTGDTGGNQISGLSALLYPATAFLVGPANNMIVSITNTLRANTDAQGQSAAIQKKFVLETNTASPVPVPAAVWLLGSALGALRLLRRRRASL